MPPPGSARPAPQTTLARPVAAAIGIAAQAVRVLTAKDAFDHGPDGALRQHVSALFFLVPPTTALIAFLVLGEALSVVAVPGMLLAIAGIYLVTRRPSSPNSAGAR